MLLTREYTDESDEYQLEAALSVPRRNFGNARLVSDNELQFGNQIHNQWAILVQRIAQITAPFVQLCLALCQQLTYEAPECLCQSRVGNVALVLVELAGSK